MVVAELHSQAELGQTLPSTFQIRESNLHRQLASHATSHLLLDPGLGVVESTQPLDVRGIAGPNRGNDLDYGIDQEDNVYQNLPGLWSLPFRLTEGDPRDLDYRLAVANF